MSLALSPYREAASKRESLRVIHPAVASGERSLSVLVTDEHYKHSLGVVRHLGRRGHRVSVVAASRNSLVCRSRFCTGVVAARDFTIGSLVDATISAVRTGRYDILIPVSYPMTRSLASHASDIRPYVGFESCDLGSIERAANKAAMMRLASEIGVPAPKTLVPMCLQEVEMFGNACGFPLVVKSQAETPGRSVEYARNANELRSVASRELLEATPARRRMLQEFIPGTGCGFFATYQRGICKRIFMHRRIREYPSRGGVSSCAEAFYDEHLESYGRRMLDALGWHGVAMVEFRKDSRDGGLKLMEINPKFWGSLDLALAAGADFPGDLCRMAAGEELAFTDDYDRTLRFHWPFSISGDLYHLWSRPQSVFDVAFDLLNPRVKSNVWPEDFGPHFEELRTIGGLLRRRKRN